MRTAIHEKNLSSLMTSDDNDDINTDWQRWSDAFMAAVKDHIPIKRLKGRNPLPWIIQGKGLRPLSLFIGM